MGVIVRTLGRLATLAVLTLSPVAAYAADWKTYETAHFVIYSDSSEKDVTRLANGLESIDGLMRMASRLNDDVQPVKVRIYQVASTDEVEAALGLSGSGVAGFYDSNVLGPFAVTPRSTADDGTGFTPEVVLHHEYAHHFMLEYFPTIYPDWYVEGYAELIGASKTMPDGRIAYGFPAKYRGGDIRNDWMSLKDVLVKPPEKIVQNFDLYGQGWAMTHFLTFSNTRAAQLRQYLAALAAGQAPAEAAKAFGDLGQLDREAFRYLNAGSFSYRPVAVPIKQPVIQRIEPVSAGEAALIPETIAFRDDDLSSYRKESERTREEKLRGDNLVRIREKAARFATDPYALYLLAAAEYAAGDYAAAETAADRLLAVRPNHVRAMTIKSLCITQAAVKLSGAARDEKIAQARRLASAANRADNNDPLPLVAFYQSYHLVGATPPRQVVLALAGASATLPQDTHIRQLLVDELAAEKKWRDAIVELSPIAYDPHQSPRRDAAREQMANLQRALAASQQTASEVISATAPAAKP